MFDKTDILKRLREGTSIETIAKEMSDALNAANDAFAEEEAKRVAEEKKVAEQKRAEAAKREAAMGIIDAYCDYAVAVGDEELLDALHDVDADAIMMTLDHMIQFTKTWDRLKRVEFPRVQENKNVKSDDDILRSWLGGLF